MRSTADAPIAPLVEVVITEALDARAVPRVRALLEDAIALHPVDLVVDLADCEFIDAAAIGMLVDVHRRIWTSGGRLTLRGLSARMHRVLEIARVDQVLHCVVPPAG